MMTDGRYLSIDIRYGSISIVRDIYGFNPDTLCPFIWKLDPLGECGRNCERLRIDVAEDRKP